MSNQYDRKIGTATSYLEHYLQTLFEAAGKCWDSDNSTEVKNMIEAIVAASLEQFKEELLEQKKKKVDPDIIEKIQSQLTAVGAQPYGEIFNEVQYHCPGLGDDLAEAHGKVNDALDLLVEARSIVRNADEFGWVYGYPTDF